MKKNLIIWEIIGYLGLALCLFGQITIGKWYLIAQFAYLIANAMAVVRNFMLNLPTANKVRDIVFTVITITLIVLRIFG